MQLAIQVIVKRSQVSQTRAIIGRDQCHFHDGPQTDDVETQGVNGVAQLGPVRAFAMFLLQVDLAGPNEDSVSVQQEMQNIFLLMRNGLLLLRGRLVVLGVFRDDSRNTLVPGPVELLQANSHLVFKGGHVGGGLVPTLTLTSGQGGQFLRIGPAQDGGLVETF